MKPPADPGIDLPHDGQTDETHVVATNDAQSGVGTLLDNVGALFMRQVAIWGFSFVIVLFVPRYLGDEGLGRITFATAILMMLVMLAGLGSDSFAVKQIAKDHSRAASMLWSTYAVRLATGLAACAGLVLALQVVPVEAGLRDVLYVTAVTIVVMSLKEAQSTVIRGMERMRWLSLAETVHKGTVMALGVGLLLLGYGVVVYAGAVLAGAIAGLAVTSVFVAPLHRKAPRIRREDLLAFVRGSVPFLLIGMMSQAIQWLDVVMLMAMTSNAVVGWYGAAIQLYTTINVLPFILAMALLPALSRLHPRSEELRRVARAGLAAVLLTAIPMAVGLILISDRVIAFLGYPEGFSNTVPLLAILAAMLPLTGVLMVLATIVASVDGQSAWARIMGYSLVLNVVLNLALIPLCQAAYGNGAIGAALAAVAAELFQLFLSLRLVPKGVLDVGLAKTFGKTLAAASAMGTIVFLVSGEAGIVPVVLAGTATYAIAVLLLRAVEPRDLRTAFGAWSARRLPDVATLNQASN